MSARPLAIVLLLAACSAGRGAVCSEASPCPAPFVCASTSSPGQRRCLLPCDRTWDGGVAVGALCSDGSVCLESDQGPVCYFLGAIPIGAACPNPACDPTSTVCDCEPGTVCHEGFCRQVCVLPPDEPRDAPSADGGVDAGRREDRVCGPLALCSGGVCLPVSP